MSRPQYEDGTDPGPSRQEKASTALNVEVDFNEFGLIALPSNQDAWWWFTWIFDGDHWSRMSAVPQNWSPAGGSVEIVEEWATDGMLHVHFRNNGSDYVYFNPTVIVAPSRY